MARRRLDNQAIANSTLETPGDVVNALGAVQAQDYLGALWAIGLRIRGVTEKQVEQALEDRTIVRTWPMRGTLHFVPAADARWMLELLTPRVIASSASRWRQLELDEATFSRSRKSLVRALQGGKRLERAALFQELESAKISTAGQRGIHILGRLAQEGLLCFGPRNGKQQTFVLLDEWVPATNRLDRESALAVLAKRYFTSHGPAQLQDFVWWSGLTTVDAREALALAQPHLVQDNFAGRSYWSAPSASAARAKRIAFLLPDFDEYLVGYKDRTAVLDPHYAKQANAGGGMLNPTIVIDGQVVGTWKRTLQKDAVVVAPQWFAPPGASDQKALAAAARRYGAFLGLTAVLHT